MNRHLIPSLAALLLVGEPGRDTDRVPSWRTSGGCVSLHWKRRACGGSADRGACFGVMMAGGLPRSIRAPGGDCGTERPRTEEHQHGAGDDEEVQDALHTVPSRTSRQFS